MRLNPFSDFTYQAYQKIWNLEQAAVKGWRSLSLTNKMSAGLGLAVAVMSVATVEKVVDVFNTPYAAPAEPQALRPILDGIIANGGQGTLETGIVVPATPGDAPGGVVAIYPTSIIFTRDENGKEKERCVRFNEWDGTDNVKTVTYCVRPSLKPAETKLELK